MRIGFAALAFSLATGLLDAQPAPLAPPPQDYVAAIGSSPLKAPVTAEFSPGATFTIEAWVYPTAVSVGLDWIAGQCLASGSADPFLGWALALNANQRADFSYSTGAAGSYRSIASSAPIALQTWTHLAAVMDGTSTRLYVNGVLAASGTAAGPAPAPGPGSRPGAAQRRLGHHRRGPRQLPTF